MSNFRDNLKIQNLHKANYCSAWILRLDRNFLAAGNLFLQLTYLPEAAECFWQGLNWLKLRQLLLENPTEQQLSSRHYY